jgi:hypothetical protein
VGLGERTDLRQQVQVFLGGRWADEVRVVVRCSFSTPCEVLNPSNEYQVLVWDLRAPLLHHQSSVHPDKGDGPSPSRGNLGPSRQYPFDPIVKLPDVVFGWH